MDGETVSDIILRGIASMREHGDLPEIESPRIVIMRTSLGGSSTFIANVGQALAAALTSDQPPLSPRAIASSITEYLREVVELVPAYHDIASVTSTEDGSILITLRGA